MADVNKIAIGGCAVAIGTWASGGGASTTDVGLLKEGSTLSDAVEHYAPEFESIEGAPVSIPIKRTIEAHIIMAETDLDKIAWVMAQPSGNLSGSSPNKTLHVGSSNEQYKKVVITGGAICGTSGTRGTRTVTLYRCCVAKREPFMMTKTKEMLCDVTLNVLLDSSVTSGGATGTYWSVVDSGGA